jgi:hypothetical protein
MSSKQEKTNIVGSSYCAIRVSVVGRDSLGMLDKVCPQTTICVSSCCYICVSSADVTLSPLFNSWRQIYFPLLATQMSPRQKLPGQAKPPAPPIFIIVGSGGGVSSAHTRRMLSFADLCWRVLQEKWPHIHQSRHRRRCW